MTLMSTKFSRALLATACALSLLTFTGCERSADPAAEDSSRSAEDDGPGAGGGYGE